VGKYQCSNATIEQEAVDVKPYATTKSVQCCKHCAHVQMLENMKHSKTKEWNAPINWGLWRTEQSVHIYPMQWCAMQVNILTMVRTVEKSRAQVSTVQLDDQRLPDCDPWVDQRQAACFVILHRRHLDKDSCPFPFISIDPDKSRTLKLFEN